MADYDVPTLEVGFAIETGASFDELTRLQQVMESTEGKVLAEATKIERATGGMVKLGGATSQISTFGNAVSREFANVVRDTNRAEKAGESMVRQLERQIEVFGKSASEIRQMRTEMKAVAAESQGLTELAARLRSASAEITRLEHATKNAAGASNASRAAVQNLGFQMSDFSVQVIGGTSVLRAFAMQFPQATGALSGFEGKLGTVGRFLNGPWGIAITLGITLLAGMADKFLESGEAAKKAADGMKEFQARQSDIGNFIDQATGKLVEQNRVLVLNAILTRKKQIADNEAAMSQQRNAAFAAARNARLDVAGNPQSWDPDIAAVQRVLDPDVQKALAAAGGNIDKLSQSLARLAQTTRPDLKGLTLDITGQAGAAIMAQRENEKLSKELRGLAGDTSALARGTTSLIEKQVGFATATSAVERARAKLALVQQGATAADKAGGAALIKYRDDLTAAMTAVNAAEAAQKAAREATRGHNKDLREAARAAKEAAAEYEKLVKWLGDTRLTAQGNVQKLAADMLKQHLEWGRGIQTVGEKMIEQDQDRAKLLEAEKQGQQDILDLYLRQLDVIQQIGGAAGTIAGFVSGLYTGNFSGVGGNFGNLLQGVTGMVGKDGWDKVTAKLDHIFGGNGSFAKTMGSLLNGGATGSAASKLLLGSQGSSMGSFIGGAFGEKLGEKLLSKGLESIAKGLGDFAGPIGSIVGGLAGGILGKLFSGTKYGYASGINVGATGGVDYNQVSNSGGRYSAGQSMATAFGSSLYDIASALGGGLNGGLNLGSLGMRNKKYIFDPTSGTSADRQSFETAEEAIAAAIQSALDKGVITGIRASTQRLLSAGDDLQSALEKAVQFEGVFTELKSYTDPVGAAVDALDKQFAQLRDVFAEAGASAAEYADLEQLYQLKKIDAIKQANSEAEELSRDRRTLEARILELQGKDLQSVAILRQIEIEQMDASLRPLQQRVWAMEDASAIIEKMRPLVESLQDYRDTLFGQEDGGLSYRAALIKLMQTGGLAAGGDATALADLQGVSQDFLTSARNNASSLAQYQRDVAMVARYVDGGIDAAQNQIDVAQATLDATNASVLLLTSIDDTLSAAADAAAISTSSATGSAASTADLGAKIDALKAELEQMRADNNAGHAATAGNTGKMVRTLDNVTAQSGGDAISTVPAA
ncbi:hypothetical protein [Sphingomonas sp. VDB2]|uniref:hypothetical protein n=1 Tax=Sphingomonas sp. VDB2 TaxID=3228751 RepID=UPI003A80A3F5